MEIDYQQAYCYYKLSPKVPLDQTSSMKAIAAMQTFINTYPNSEKAAEANVVIDLLRRKLEQKEFNAAELYYNLGHYKAAGVSFKSLMRAYRDSEKSDSYKYMAIKSYYLYAKNSVYYKQKERYETVFNRVPGVLRPLPDQQTEARCRKILYLSKK